MNSDIDGRQCPICEQIVHSSMIAIPVKIFPGKTVLLHEGCAMKVEDSLIEFRKLQQTEEE